MTIKELLNHQCDTGHLCLIRQGLFFRGYNQAAAMLSELMGYQVKAKEVLSCGEKLFYVGFPASATEKVVEKVVASGGLVVRRDEQLIEFSGVEVQYDEASLLEKVIASQPRTKAKTKNSTEKTLAEQVVEFDLTNNTPVECMNFIARLQQLH